MAAELEPDLLARLQSSDTSARRAAAGELFERTHEQLFQVALRMTGRRELADEAVQETYVRVLHSVAKFRGDAGLSTWIYRIAVRESLRASARGRRPVAELPEDLRCDRPGHPTDLAEADAAARILALIARLPEAQRMVFSLTAVDGLSRAEVAKILGVPIGTVDSRLGAARETLRAQLG